jgi:hypothetical protein
MMKRKRSAFADVIRSDASAAAAASAAQELGAQDKSQGSAPSSAATATQWPDLLLGPLPSDTEVFLRHFRARYPSIVTVKGSYGNAILDDGLSHVGAQAVHATSLPLPVVTKSQLISRVAPTTVDTDLADLGRRGLVQVCRLPLNEEDAVVFTADLERYLNRRVAAATAALTAASAAAAAKNGSSASSASSYGSRTVLGPQGKNLARTAGQRVTTALVDLWEPNASSATHSSNSSSGGAATGSEASNTAGIGAPHSVTHAAILAAIEYFRLLRALHVREGSGGSVAVSEESCLRAFAEHQHQKHQHQHQHQQKERSREGEESGSGSNAEAAQEGSARKRMRLEGDGSSDAAVAAQYTGNTARSTSSTSTSAASGSGSGSGSPESSAAFLDTIRTLLSLGLLMRRTDVRGAASSVKGYFFGVPECGRLVRWLRDGRADLLTRLRKSKHEEMPWSTLIKAKLPRSPLPPAFHAADIIGLGLAREVNTASGPFLRLATSAGAPPPR